MQTKIEEQIDAVYQARLVIEGIERIDSRMYAATAEKLIVRLNDAASTLAAVKLQNSIPVEFKAKAGNARLVEFKKYVPVEYIEDPTATTSFQRRKKEGTGCYVEGCKGMFHQWGLDEENGASYTVGIIEEQDGTVHSIPVRHMKFLS